MLFCKKYASEDNRIIYYKKENNHSESSVEMHLPLSNNSNADAMPSLMDVIMSDKEKSLIILKLLFTLKQSVYYN